MDDRTRILIADDDKSTRKTLSAILGRLGYEIDMAETGQEALEKAREKSFNLAILDIRLPDMNGVALLAPLKTIHPDIIIVIVTAYATVETAVRALNDGAFAYITKPINTDELLATIREGLEKQQLIVGKRQAECGKVESDEALRAFIENARDAIFAHDLAGKLTSANRQAETLIGYSREELIGKNFAEMGVLPDDQIPRTMARLDKNVTGDLSEPFELELITKEGSRRAVEIMSFPASRNGNEEIWCIARDITERKQAEQALRGSEERFRALTEHGSDGISIVDADGTTMYESESLERILGHTAVSQIGGNVFDLVHPEDLASAEDAFQSIPSNPSESLTVVLRVRDAEGSWHWMECTGRSLLDSPAVGGVVINYHDITERKQAEEALRDSEERFRMLVENAFESVVLVGKDGSILYESPSGERILGYTPEDMVGRSMLDFLHPDDLADVSALFATVLSNPGSTASTEIRFKHKDGSWRWCEATGTNLLGDPRVNAIVANYRDITDRKQAEEALREKDERLQALIQNAPDAIIIADAAGDFIGLNRSIEELTGYSEEELLGKNFINTRLFTDEDTPKLLEIGANSLEGKVTEPTEIEFITKEGSRLCAEIKAFPVENKGHVEVIAIARDITERKQAEEALRESEEKYRSVVERANDGIAIVQDGVIKYLNPRLEEMLGCEPEELIDVPMPNLVHPDVRANVVDRYKRRMQGEEVPDTYDTVLLHKNGSGVAVELSSGVVTYEGRPAALGIMRDITERKQAENALRDSEERFRSLIENSSDALAVLNADGTIMYQSSSVERIFGEAPDELVGTSFADFIHPDDIAGLTAVFNFLSNAPGASSQFETRFRHKDGTWRWIEAAVRNLLDDPKVGGFVVNYRDITERKESETALQESEEKLRVMFESIADGISIVDLGGNILEVNEAGARIAGYDQKEELIGRSGIGFLAEEARAGVLESLIRTLEEEGSVTMEHAVTDKDGRQRNVQVSSTLLYDNSGEPARIVSISKDITERRQAEEELRRLAMIAEQAGEGIATTDLDGNIQFVNKAWATIHGYETTDELIGKHLSMFHTDEQLEADVTSFNEEVKRNGFHTGEVGHMRHDGSTFPTEMTTTMLKDGQGNPMGLIGFATDITERKQAENALRESEKRASELADMLPEIIFETDMEGNFTYVNRRGSELVGYTQEDVDGGLNALQVFAPEDRPKLMENMAKLFAGEYVGNPEYTVLKKDGGTFRALTSGSPIIRDNKVCGIRGIVIDITDRERAEQALRESEGRLRLIFNNVSDMIVLVDLSGTTISVNDKITDVFGLSPEEALGRSFAELDLLDSEQLSELSELFMECVSQETSVRPLLTARAKHRDGHEILLEIKATTMTGPQGKLQGFLSIISDVTERERAERALRESEERLSAILNSLLTGIVIIDAETHTIVDVNPLAAEMIGASKEDIVGKTCHKFMCQDDEGKCPATDLGQSIDNSEHILVTAKGEEVPIIKTVIPTLLNGRMHIIDSFIDISDRKQAEQALQESEEKLRQIFNSVADMIVVIDTIGNILNVNDSVETIFGLRADEVLGRNFAELGVINPDDLPEVAKLLADSVASKKTIQTVFEIRGIHKDGHAIPIEVVSSSTVGLDENDEGKLKGMLATIRDVSERRRAEEELAKVKREKEAQLVQSAKLANLGEMATGIAHEINQPLNIIKLTCSGMGRSMRKGKTITPEMLAGELEGIDNQIERMRAIIDHMRTFARRSSDVKSEYTNMNVPLTDCFKFVGEQLRLREVQVHLELEELPQVMADSNKMEQVFLNLVGNARDAMDNFAGSAGSDYKKLLKVRSFVENGNAVVTFTDTGGGIPEKIRDRVFEPFFTTKEVGKGTGLGLSISYSIIRDADGELSFSVEEGVGTTFKIAVPISQKQPTKEDQD